MTANKDKLHKLQLLQNTACRTLLLADKYSNVKDMHIALELHQLKDRRQFYFSTLCHKNVHTEESTGLSKLFIKLETHQARRTRASNEFNIVVPDIRSNCGRKAITFRGPQHWNKLANQVKQCN